MNIFNRIAMILIILVLLAGVVLLLLFPWSTTTFVQANLSNLQELLGIDQFFGFFYLGMGLLFLILLIFLWLEIRRVSRKTVQVKTASQGDARLSIQSVAQNLAYRIDELAGVRKVDPHLVSHGRDVEVMVDLDTGPSVNVPSLSDQIVEICYQVLEEQLGLRLRGKVQLNITQQPYPRVGKVEAAPAPKMGPAAAGAEAVSAQPEAQPVSPLEAEAASSASQEAPVLMVEQGPEQPVAGNEPEADAADKEGSPA